MLRKRALIVGIDHYDDPNIGHLSNAVNDAKAVCKYLKTHEPQHSEDIASENYDIEFLYGELAYPVTREALYKKIKWLFEGNMDGALFYFAGHATRSDLDENDYLVTSDGRLDNLGVDMSYLMRQANDGLRKNTESSTIILDCCHSGAAGVSYFSDQISTIGKGVTLLTSCEINEGARDTGGRDGHGAFTSLLLDGLEGQSSDILGRVTPASLYTLIDSRLGATEQRPVYKTNVNRFVEIRKCEPKISRRDLALLNSIFPAPRDTYQLSPAHERIQDRGKGFEDNIGSGIPFSEALYKTYRALQACFKNGLVEVQIPTEKPKVWDPMTDNAAWPPRDSGSFSMWHAAIFSAKVELNHVGRHYWALAKEKRLGS